MPRTNLLVSRSDAEAKLKSRISIGEKLLEIKITTEYEWENANVERKKWHGYNRELLKRLVDTEELVEDYDSPRVGSIPINPTVEDLRERFISEVKYYLGNLASIHERLELIPEARSPESALTPNPATYSKSPDLQQRIKLFQILCDHFDESELKTLCFHLGVDYDALPDVGKNNKARELIDLFERQDRIQELVEEGKKLGPNAKWDRPKED